MLYYRTYERGPGHDWVVFLHGAGGSSSIWFKQLRDFREQFNVLLVDLRGHGGSRNRLPERSGEPYTFRTVSRDVIEVLDAEGIERAHFVGISLGCLIVRTLAELAPERVQTMTLGGAILHLNRRARLLMGLGNALKRVVPFMWLYRFFAWIIMPRPTHRESRDLFVSDANKLNQQEFLRWFRLTREVNALLQSFRETELPIPTLYLMGAEDHMFLPSVRRLAQEQTWSTLEVLPDSGHVTNVDRPQRFNALALAFIEQHSEVKAAAAA